MNTRYLLLMDKIKQHILIFSWICLNILPFRAWSVIKLKWPLQIKKMLKKGKLKSISQRKWCTQSNLCHGIHSVLSITVKCLPSMSIIWWMDWQNMVKSYNKMQKRLMTSLFNQHVWMLCKFLSNFARIHKLLNSIVLKVYTKNKQKYINSTCVFS